MRHGSLIAGILMGGILSPCSSEAQYTADFQTNIISGVTSNWADNSFRGGYYVGSNTFGDVLLIQNSGVLSNGNSYLGYEIGSSNNNALITGIGSVWSNRNGLFLGYSGAGNSLVISNGGRVVSDLGGNYSVYVGNNASSIGNTVLITSSNSLWSSSAGFIVGVGGNSNRMVINCGGRLDDFDGFVGGFGGGSSNAVLVTDAGSMWNNLRDLRFDTTGNSLVISNGGKVLNAVGRVGTFNDSGSNTVRVTDAGVWQNSVLYVGNQGSSNSLVVDGGSVSATNLVIGGASAVCDNLLQLDNGSVIVTNAPGNAVFEVRYGKLILNGGVLQVDRFVMTNACAQFVRTGGTLIYEVAVLDPNRDDDGDGIPNGWEQAHGLDPLNDADANVDSDGDGFTNLQEYLTGTDPTNSASSFRITSLVETGHDLLVKWTTGTGKTNALQTVTGNFGSYTNNFTTIFTVTNTTGTTTNYLDVGAATNVQSLYYRVRLVP